MLKKDQIEFIENDLRLRGVFFSRLEEDIVDYVCEAVEKEMNNGVRFMEAYQKIMKDFGPVTNIQEDTINTLNHFTMVKHFVKVTLRNMLREKLYSVINIGGLSIGLACAFLIMLFITNELSYDRFHTQAEHIYRLGQRNQVESTVVKEALTPPALAQQLRLDYPQVLSTVRLFSIGLNDGIKVRIEDREFLEKKATYADSTFFNFFDFALTEGAPEQVLLEPQSVVLSESARNRHFPNERAVGKIMEVDGELFEVTGIMKDMPHNSHFHYDLLMSMSSFGYSRYKEWTPSGIYTYLRLEKGTDIGFMEKGFPTLIEKYYGPEIAVDFGLFLQPLVDIHLKSNIDWEVEPNGDIRYVRVFGIVGILVVLIAGINFMNLMTARSGRKIKEIGIRKALGSSKTALKWQFLVESLGYCTIAFLFGLLWSYLLLDPFNSFSGASLTLNLVHHWWLLVGLFAVSIITGLAAGGYATFYLTSFNAIQVLKKEILIGPKSGFFRASLVTFQFIVSTGLIIATLIIYQQLDYMSSKKLGFDKEQTMVVSINDLEDQQVKTLKEELRKLPGVAQTAKSSSLPSRTYAKTELNVKGNSDNKVAMYFLFADEDYVPAMNIEIVKGRNFSPDFSTDTSAIVLNEAAVVQLGIENPIGQKIEISWPITGEFKVIGVTGNYNFQSLRNRVEPLVMSVKPRWQEHLIVRLHSEDYAENIAAISATWNRVTKHKLFEYFFLDQDFDALLGKERRMGKLFIVFTTLAILIACMGLVGLSYYSVEQKFKEIGIRKVMGATTANISFNLVRDFMKLVLIGYLLAVPISHYLMSQWLSDFAFRTNISANTFLIGGGITLFLALLTIIYQTVQAASANPVRTLRYE